MRDLGTKFALGLRGLRAKPSASGGLHSPVLVERIREALDKLSVQKVCARSPLASELTLAPFSRSAALSRRKRRRGMKRNAAGL